MTFGINVVGERLVEARFDKFPERVRAQLKRVIGEVVQELDSAVQAAEPFRTGKLRAETRYFVDDNPNFIRGRVRVVAPNRIEAGKAAALEYGAHGASPVQAYARTLSQIYGRIISPTQIMVGAYDRQLDLPADAFLRGPLAARKSEIMARLKAAIGTAAEEN